jgi:hypothetical protein
VKQKKPPELSIAEILERIGDVTRRRSNKANADALGSTPTTVSNWKSRNTIPWEMLYRFAHEHGVSFEWLLSGTGPMSAAAWGEAGARSLSQAEAARYEKMIERYEWIIDNLRSGPKGRA